MTRPTWRGALLGSALLALSPANADEYRGVSYVLVTEADGYQRLFLFDEHSELPDLADAVPPPTQDRLDALRLVNSSVPADRVRGLTLLSGATDATALDIAIALMSDSSVAVRYEAEQVVADHPLASSALRDELVEEDF